MLLELMAVGAETPIDTADSWSEYLCAAPFGEAFIVQLRREWYPATPVDDFGEKLAEKCRDQISAWHSGWPNLWSHMQRVTGYALYLAPYADVEPVLAFALAMLHDIGKFDELREGTPHETIAARAARKYLEKRYPPATVSAISMAVGKDGNPNDPYVKLLHDADKLDKIGASGIVRRVSQTLTLPNALSALDRIAFDLSKFPAMRHAAAQEIADHKIEFTEAFIAAAKARVTEKAQ